MSAGANKGAEGLRWFVETQTMEENIETMDIYVYLLVNNTNKGGGRIEMLQTYSRERNVARLGGRSTALG
jgi:hypothetical protein